MILFDLSIHAFKQEQFKGQEGLSTECLNMKRQRNGQGVAELCLSKDLKLREL
jgi:hypothetical protein